MHGCTSHTSNKHNVKHSAIIENSQIEFTTSTTIHHKCWFTLALTNELATHDSKRKENTKGTQEESGHHEILEKDG